MSFQVPPTIRFTADTAFQVSIAGKTTLGTLFSSGNTAALTIAATSARLLTVSPASGAEGETLAVTVTGEFTSFQAGTTQASLGAGISVGGGPSGDFGPVAVLNSNTVLAAAKIDASAAPGARTVTLRTGPEQASLPGAFTVLCSYSLSNASASIGPTGGSGLSLFIATGPACFWTASTTAPWITITSAQGTGNGSVTYDVSANNTTVKRVGTIVAGGQTVTITQGGVCALSINPSAKSFPVAGASGATLQVFGPAGCIWNASASAPWIVIRPATASGSGNGEVIYDIAPNTTSSQRAGMITVEGLTHVIAQAAGQSFTCNTSAATPKIARAEGRTEQLADILLTCSGDSPSSTTGDIVVTLNTGVGSKTIDANGEVDALLLVGNNAFLGTLAGSNVVRFADVPLASAGANQVAFRITNLRGDMSLNGSVSATVVIQPETVVTNATQVVAVATPGLMFSRGTPSVAGGQTNLPLTFQEQIPGAFKVRIAGAQDPSVPGTDYGTESGFVNTGGLRIRDRNRGERDAPIGAHQKRSHRRASTRTGVPQREYECATRGAGRQRVGHRVCDRYVVPGSRFSRQ